MRRISILFLLVAVFFLFGCNGYEPDTPQALPYKIIHSESVKLAGKVLCEQYISIPTPPKDYTKVVQENIAHTAMKAAWEAYDSARPNVPDVVVIFVPQDERLIGKGYLLGKAVFAQSGVGLDGKERPRWEVQAVKRMPSYEQVQANAIFEDERKEYDEDIIKQVLSEKLNIPVSQIPTHTFPDSYSLK